MTDKEQLLAENEALLHRLGDFHAVVEQCLYHLEHAGGDAGYIDSHVSIRLRGILDNDLAHSAIHTYKKSRKRWKRKAEEAEARVAAMEAVLQQFLEPGEGYDALLSRDLYEQIVQLVGTEQEEIPFEIPGKEDNRPFQGGGAGGFSDLGK